MGLFKNKSILLTITSDCGFYTCFEDNLNYLKFKNITIIRKLPFKYKSKKDKIFNFIHKAILKNKDYKKQLIQKGDARTNEHLDFLNTINDKFDYNLSIRADLFDNKLIEKTIEKSTKSYAYQWDGLKRYPKITSVVDLFDKFYVFDSNDITSKTDPSTNFYFDCYDDLIKNTSPEFDVYYLGSFDHRINETIEVCEKLHKLGLKLNIIIPSCSIKEQEKLKKYSYMSFPKKGLTYKENIIQVANSKIILDFVNHKIHNGLSFRAFEALGYNKKIITTNTLIKNYDFYTPENICVYSSLVDLNNFIISPLKVVDSKIKQKYSFTNWLKYILEQKDAIKIVFPKL